MATGPASSADDSRARNLPKVLAMPGVHRVRRPATDQGPAFDLTYVRSGAGSSTPIVVLPGGPGLAAVMPYQAMRRRAAGAGLDVVMIEHRGVGASRTDTAGADLGPEALAIPAVVDDIAAVLDAEGIEQAVIYGSSYGSYLAQVFGATHPQRVAAMVLDSVVLDAHGHDAEREYARDLLWRGQRVELAELARKIRVLAGSGAVDVGELGQAVRITFEFGGSGLTERLLDQFVRGRAHRTWRQIAELTERETDQVAPFVMEFDLVGVIAFRDLNYAGTPDGKIFDRSAKFTEMAQRYPAFAGEAYDLRSALPQFSWPLVVLSGDRDLRTPRPVATEVAGLAPEAQLVALPNTGHSALDTHTLAAVETMGAMVAGRHEDLDSQQLGTLPRRGISRHVATMIRAALGAERLSVRRRPPRAPAR